MINTKHTVRINIANANDPTKKQEILRTTKIRLPKKILEFFFGEMSDIMVIVPNETVRGIIIREEPPSCN